MEEFETELPAAAAHPQVFKEINVKILNVQNIFIFNVSYNISIHILKASLNRTQLCTKTLLTVHTLCTKTLLTVHTLCTKTLLTVHSLNNYMF